MRTADFDFDLADHLIATRPARPRSSARLLVAGPDSLTDHRVSDLSQFLRPGDRLVLNDTKVIPARIKGIRTRETKTGPVKAKIDITLLEPQGGARWSALAKPLRKLNPGDQITFTEALGAEVVEVGNGQTILNLNTTGNDLDAAIESAGQMPLPPYIAAKRAPDEQDRTDYQTIWAENRGAVAAPTASLHFDQSLLDRLRQGGVDFTYVTLHVGAGTFLPVKVDDVTDHKMHSERGSISTKAADEINDTRTKGGRIIPVGTTALRLIESAADTSGQLHPWEGATDIFIYPGYNFRVTDGLMTNFHLPQSTLMMLVSALMGVARIRKIYAHAIHENYRFFSYGDASLLLPKG